MFPGAAWKEMLLEGLGDQPIKKKGAVTFGRPFKSHMITSWEAISYQTHARFEVALNYSNELLNYIISSWVLLPRLLYE